MIMAKQELPPPYQSVKVFPDSENNSTTPPTESFMTPGSLLQFLQGVLDHWKNKLDPPPKDERYEQRRVENLDEVPAGYPQLAAVINADPNFRVYRRFGTLRNRVILWRQHELTVLETRLRELDETDIKDPELAKRLKSVRRDKDDNESGRALLIEEIDQKLEQYDNLLARERDSLLYEKPTETNRRSVVNHIWNSRAFFRSEIGFIEWVEDLVILSKEQDSPFHVFVERVISVIHIRWFQRLFATRTQREMTTDPATWLYSKARIDGVVKTVVLLFTITALLIPVVLLFNLKSSDKVKIVIVTVFMLAFPPFIALFCRAKNHELFAIIAAYCAVLVVFLGNIATQS